MENKIRAIITGSTGWVGKGVLKECLENEQVESVLVINRKPVGIEHPKLKEIIHADFFNLDSVQHELEGYNACFFCLGVSAFRMSEEQYTKLSYDLTLNFAKALLEKNSDLTFCYVSGAGTDSTETGRSMWARVKGKTENALIAMGFKNAFAFRPAYIKPDKDTSSKTTWYSVMIPILKVLHPVIKTLFPRYSTTTQAIARAMIRVSLTGYDKKHIEVVDINRLAGGNS